MSDISKPKGLQRAYISELDRFLHNFDKKPEAYSESRYAEQAKHEKIARLRDYPIPPNIKDEEPFLS